MTDYFKLLGKVVIDTGEADDALKSTAEKGQQTGNKLTKTFKSIGKAVAGYFAVKQIVNFGKNLTNMAANAETAFAKVNTLLKDGTDTNKYFKEIMEASTKTGIAMSDYSEAVYQAISAGVDQAESIDFVQQAAMLAKGGFTETATAVDVLTTAMNAYGLSSDQAAHISDVLITTQNLGKTTVDELSSSMGKIIPLASAYNVNIENLGAAYATMTAGGIGTAESSTYLKSMFTELGKEGSDVSKILKSRTKKSFAELMASGYSLGDVLSLLYKSCGGNATAFANLWSSTEAGTGALAIVNAGVDGFNETLDSMENSTGATEAAYNKMMGTFSEKVNKLKNTFTNAGISIGSKFLPALGKIVDGVTDWVQPAFEKFESYFKGVFGEDGTIDWNKLGESFSTMFKDLGSKIPSLLKSVGHAISAAWENGVWPMIQGLFQAAFGIELPDWATIKTSITDWWNGVKAQADSIIRAVFGIEGGDTWENVKQKFTDWWDTTKSLVTGIFQALFGIEGGATWEDVSTIFQTWWDSISSFVSNIFTAIWQLGEGNETWENVMNIFSTWWNGISSMITSVFSAVWKLADGTLTWEDVLDIFQTWWDSVSNMVESIFQAVFSIGGGETWENVKDVFTTWWDSVKTSISSIFTAAWKLADGTLTWEDVKDIFTTWWDTIKTSVETILKASFGITLPSIEDVKAKIRTWWEGVKASLGLTVSYEVSTTTHESESGTTHGGGVGQGFANGLDFVSQDGMLARLHYGEAVLNRTDAKNYRDGSGTGGMMALAEKFDRMMAVMESGFTNMNQQIVLDSGVLVGATVGMIDNQLGTMAGRKGRGN